MAARCFPLQIKPWPHRSLNYLWDGCIQHVLFFLLPLGLGSIRKSRSAGRRGASGACLLSSPFARFPPLFDVGTLLARLGRCVVMATERVARPWRVESLRRELLMEPDLGERMEAGRKANGWEPRGGGEREMGAWVSRDEKRAVHMSRAQPPKKREVHHKDKTPLSSSRVHRLPCVQLYNNYIRWGLGAVPSAEGFLSCLEPCSPHIRWVEAIIISETGRGRVRWRLSVEEFQNLASKDRALGFDCVRKGREKGEHPLNKHRQ